MRLWCFLFGHKLRRPRKSMGESGLYTTCLRCDAFFIRDYFSGWQPASDSEKTYYLKMYGPKVGDPKNEVDGDVVPARDAAPEERLSAETGG